jgi:aminopeptidase N
MPHDPSWSASPRRSLATGLVLLLVAAGCGRGRSPDPEPGVARTLAESRARAIADLRYAVRFDLPAEKDSAVSGEVEASFTWSGAGQDLVLDFRAPAGNVGMVTLDGDTVAHRVVTDHIVLPGAAVTDGAHRVRVRFRSTDAALNRNEGFLYALFVPDRASTAFPVFEQPDLKARWTVTLSVPAEWDALSNGALVSRDSSGGARHVLTFAESEPISTYLLSFAAGRLQRLEGERDGRRYTMFHRETDAAKVARNAKSIFDLHAAAVKWLEAYTGIAYPFGKFDFFAVPAFQFGGMEHPGAVWYRADALLLDESPSRTQELGRASLIAHETAHMWFGDLVTMRWFEDVWMKEVFANFMAAKIVTPAFPDVDHDLRFFQAHHASAYGVDRTPGANAIRQDLANLREAGSLYGAIIYQKAPVGMKQLETLVGDTTFRDGLRRYLDAHRFGNATWTDLVAVLDELTSEDVRRWSASWVEAPGRPTIEARWESGGLVLRQRDDWSTLSKRFSAPRRAGGPVFADREMRWTQSVDVLLAWGGRTALVRGPMRGDSVVIPVPGDATGEPDLILPGVDGQSYGRFPLNESSRTTLLARAGALERPLQRAVAWQGLYEEMIDGTVPPRVLLDAALASLGTERDELVASQLTGLVRGTFWRWLDDSTRLAVAAEVERVLWAALARAPNAGRKGSLFGTIIGVTLTTDGVARLERIWRRTEVPRGFPVSESQFISIAEGLALRGVPDAAAILDEQEERITNPDRKARQRFMRAALSAERSVRDSLFRTFAQVENRRRESWVLDAMSAMNHPLRAAESVANLEPSLALTAEIQATGDIFFPLNWLNATLGGHQSAEAAAIVAEFLQTHQELAPRLRGKMMQAADDLFRAARVVQAWNGEAAPTR